jgi:CelD/BcsL family acetyltransferase involved in cellulose biosynthesis
MPDRKLTILEADPDRAEWLEYWASTGREPFAHPGYVQLCTSNNERPVLLVDEHPTGTSIMPLILRPLSDMPWAQGAGVFDATSPYGYGGPFSRDGLADDFWTLVHRWSTEAKLVSLFGRLSLDVSVGSQLPCDLRAITSSQNVVVDVARSAEAQWMHYEHKVRKNVKKAKRAGLAVEVRSTYTDLHEFCKLYAATMVRRSAAAEYHFGSDFFAQLADRLKGFYWVAEVRTADGRLVSAELVLVSDRYAYSFLGGTYADAFPHAPNDLLKHAVIDRARNAGLRGYVLGGGYRPADGIFRYKRGFDPTGVTDFHRLEARTGEVYEQMVQLRLDFEHRSDVDAQLLPTHFPRYRAPLEPQG